jgi:nitroimidazol reductase NimA-like FMN-containing flavoprotein (pyridoxamine 5'-phosphate oxidase superfamily)
MTADEIHDYLDTRSEWAVLTTLSPTGFPHSVTLGYFRLGDDIYLGMKDGTQKVRNAQRDPRASVLVTTSKESGVIDGVLLQGRAAILRDDAERLAVAQEAARQRGKAESTATVSADGVYLRLTPERVISWRYD